jgi:ribonucleoside-diphosphate reductase beta chain
MTSFVFEGQGDPGTVEDPELERFELLTPQRLYYLWERNHWEAGALSFEQDRRDWEEMPEMGRALLLKTLAPFFAAEERVAAVFSPILMSADSEQEAAFLATQQVDEARHMQFFDRFWREVFTAGGDGEVGASAIADARARCNDAFTELFDRRLTDALDPLRLDPTDVEARVEAVTIYHLIAEGVLGLCGQHFVLGYLERSSIMPGICEGFRNVKRDEHRHVAWGTWYLRRRCREDDRYGEIVQNTVMELLPVASSVIIDEGLSAVCDGLDEFEFLDVPSAELNHYALTSLARRLKVIGGATKEIHHFAASGAWRAARVLH